MSSSSSTTTWHAGVEMRVRDVGRVTVVCVDEFGGSRADRKPWLHVL